MVVKVFCDSGAKMLEVAFTEEKDKELDMDVIKYHVKPLKLGRKQIIHSYEYVPTK